MLFLDELPYAQLPEAPLGVTLEMVGTVPVQCDDKALSLRVQYLSEVGEELQRSVYDSIFPNPNDFAEEYRAIGVLKAVGWSPRNVLELTVWEGTIVSLLSVLTGLVAAQIHLMSDRRDALLGAARRRV